MRGTVAKRLRRASGFVPNDAREYLDPGVFTRSMTGIDGKRKLYPVTKPIATKAGERGFYQQLKKAYNA